MRMNHSPCWMSVTGIDLADDMPGGLLARDASKDGADSHPDPGHIPLAEDVARHDLSRREDVRGGRAVPHDHLGLLVHRDSKVGERDSGAQRIRKKGWGI